MEVYMKAKYNEPKFVRYSKFQTNGFSCISFNI